jgi:hypothetical protein
MLIAHVRQADRPDQLPPLERQLGLVVDAVTAQPDLHSADRARLLAVSEDTTDPAEHGDTSAQD